MAEAGKAARRAMRLVPGQEMAELKQKWGLEEGLKRAVAEGGSAPSWQQQPHCSGSERPAEAKAVVAVVVAAEQLRRQEGSRR